MANKKLGKILVDLTKKATKPFTATSVKTSSTIRKTGDKIKPDLYYSTVEKKHAAGRSKQVARIIDRKKRTASEAPVTKKKGSALKTIGKVAGATVLTGAGLTAGIEYGKKEKAAANKAKVNANKVNQNVSKVNANTFKNYKNEEKVAENTRKVAENKAKVQDNAVKVYSNAAKVNASKASNATTNAQKVAANKAKIEANKKKVAANAAKYK